MHDSIVAVAEREPDVWVQMDALKEDLSNLEFAIRDLNDRLSGSVAAVEEKPDKDPTLLKATPPVIRILSELTCLRSRVGQCTSTLHSLFDRLVV